MGPFHKQAHSQSPIKLSQTRQLLLKDDHLLLLPHLPSSASACTFETLFHVPVDGFRSNYWLDPSGHSKLMYVTGWSFDSCALYPGVVRFYFYLKRLATWWSMALSRHPRIFNCWSLNHVARRNPVWNELPAHCECLDHYVSWLWYRGKDNAVIILATVFLYVI